MQRRDFLDLLLVSEGFTGLIHELNNRLNTIMLQSALIDMKAGDSVKDETTLIRQEAKQVAARLTPFQHAREQRRQTRLKLDLNDVVQRVLSDYPEFKQRLSLELSPRPLFVSANELALEQLVHVLIRAVCDNKAQAAARLRVRTEQTDQQVRLLVGADAPAAEIVDLLDPQSRELEDVPLIQQLAAQSLARLLQVKLSAALGAGGAVAFSAAWPAS